VTELQRESQMPSFVALREALEFGYHVNAQQIGLHARLSADSLADTKSDNSLISWAVKEGAEQAARHYWQQEME